MQFRLANSAAGNLLTNPQALALIQQQNAAQQQAQAQTAQHQNQNEVTTLFAY
jgi:hypothetical protein